VKTHTHAVWWRAFHIFPNDFLFSTSSFPFNLCGVFFWSTSKIWWLTSQSVQTHRTQHWHHVHLESIHSIAAIGDCKQLGESAKRMTTIIRFIMLNIFSKTFMGLSNLRPNWEKFDECIESADICLVQEGTILLHPNSFCFEGWQEKCMLSFFFVQNN